MNGATRCRKDSAGVLAGTLAASMSMSGVRSGDAAGGARPPAVRVVRGLLPCLRVDRLVELQVAGVVDRVDAVVRQRRVAVIVDGVLAQHAVAILGGEERLEDVRLGA